MARAGFYAVESGRISFGRDGRWYSDGERIDNERIALLFSRSIRQSPDGGYYLEVGEERAPVDVQDTPYVVRAVEGDGERGFSLMLNDGERERLDPTTLEVGAHNVLYCRVKGGRFRARFLRSAYYHLSDCFRAGLEAGSFYALIGGCRYQLGRAGGGGTRRA